MVISRSLSALEDELLPRFLHCSSGTRIWRESTIYFFAAPLSLGGV